MDDKMDKNKTQNTCEFEVDGKMYSIDIIDPNEELDIFVKNDKDEKLENTNELKIDDDLFKDTLTNIFGDENNE
jgi:hypothetical protein